MRETKKGEFNFALLFAIVAGAAILILAIYAAVRIGDTQRYQTDTETAKKISIITDPLQAGFTEGKFGKISFTSETRINNNCFDEDFGKNDISTSTRSGVGKEWQDAGGATSVYNKYIFSDKNDSGKIFYVFSKPFDFPYKVSDLIFITSKKYCFKNAPDIIKDEVEGLNIPNIAIENCSAEDISVCFGAGSCDINVYGSCTSYCESVYDEGYVEKQGEELFYVGSLVYAGIFASPEIYNCNVKRLTYRAGSIASIFLKKIDLMEGRDCNTNLKADLIYWQGLTANATSKDLISLNYIAKDMEIKNEKELCGVW